MEKDNRNAYSEVIEILKWLDEEEKLEALPIEMLEVLKSKANPEYKPQISKEIPLEEQNLQPETMAILSWIAMKYWNKELNEENGSKEITNEDNKENQENLDNIEKIEENETKEENIETKDEDIDQKEDENNLPVVHKDLKWYEKIKEKILEFFGKIFKKNKKEGSTL